MSTLAVNTITNAAGANTAQINGMTPTAQSLQGFRNRVINGDMRIDQRNAGAAVTIVRLANSVYATDRWSVFNGGTNNGNVTAERDGVSSPSGNGFVNSLKLTNVTGGAANAADNYSVFQPIEGLNIADWAWGTGSAVPVTLSFWVRASVTGTYGAAIRNSAADRSYVVPFTVNVANTWEYKTATISGPTTGTWLTTNGVGLYLSFAVGVGSNFQTSSTGTWLNSNVFAVSGQVNQCTTTGATFYITGVQLEAGSVATPFERRPYGTELALCQRYYQRIGSTGVVGGAVASGLIYNASTAILYAKFTTTMRAAPTGSVTSAASYQILYNGTNPAPTSITPHTHGTDSTRVDVIHTGMTIASGAVLLCNSITDAIQLSAEL